MNKELFRFIRIANHLTQREFAQLLGVSHGLVAQIEAGMRRITPRVERRIFSSLKLTSEDIEKYKKFLIGVGINDA